MEDKKIDWQYRFFVENALKQLEYQFMQKCISWQWRIVEKPSEDLIGYRHEVIVYVGVGSPAMSILRTMWVDASSSDVAKEKAWIGMVTAVMQAGMVKVYQDMVMLHRNDKMIFEGKNTRFAQYPVTPQESFERLNAPQGNDDGK